MRFGIFGAAQAGSPNPGGPMGHGFHDFIDFNVEAEALGYHSTFLVEHHFTGWNQVSATLTLLTWLAARTTTLRLGTAVIRRVAMRGYNLLLDQFPAFDVIGERIAPFKAEGAARGRAYHPMSIALARDMHVADDQAAKDACPRAQSPVP